jgi:broad specificity phosphatase PhoE
VTTRLSVVCHSSTSATNAAAFGADEPLDRRGLSWAVEARGRVRAGALVACSPAAAPRQTAAALGLDADPEPLLRDWDLGRWRGRTLEDVASTEPQAVQSWLTDPDDSPHGGETLTNLLLRVREWLNLLPAGQVVAITHPAIVRAAVVTALAAPARSFWQVDIAPLTLTVLGGAPGRWTVRTTGCALRGRQSGEM